MQVYNGLKSTLTVSLSRTLSWRGVDVESGVRNTGHRYRTESWPRMHQPERGEDGLTFVPLAHAQLDRAINLCHRQVDLPPLLGSPPPPPLFHRVECSFAHRAGSFTRFKHPRFEVPRDEVSDRVAQVRDREGHLGREGVVDEEGVVEVRRLEVVQLLRAGRASGLGSKKKKQGLISWPKRKYGI